MKLRGFASYMESFDYNVYCFRPETVYHWYFGCGFVASKKKIEATSNKLQNLPPRSRRNSF